MAINEGDFVKLDFTGTEAETGNVFETTSQDIAEEAGIYNEKRNYAPITVVIGAGSLWPALENAILDLNEGDSKKITLKPEEAFGERNPESIQLYPMKDFKKQNITPVPGMTINFGDYTGKVLTVSGGRVKVDFNSPLAGKDVNYDVSIVKILEDDEEKVKSIIATNSTQKIDLDNTTVEFDGDIIKIELDSIARFDQSKTVMDITLERSRIAKLLYDNLPYTNVQFIDDYFKPEKEEDKEESEE